MFKLICDIYTRNAEASKNEIPQGKFAPKAKKYNRIIAYNNCKVCSVGEFKLTSSSESVTEEDASRLINTWNRGALSPINKAYYKAYSDILDMAYSYKFDFSKFKYIALFEKDPGLYQKAVSEQLQLVQVFETIIDTSDLRSAHMIPSTKNTPRDDSEGYRTGYKEYHTKSPDITITNSTGSTFFTFGVLKQLDNVEYFKINDAVVAFLLRNKATLNCLDIHDAEHYFEKYFVYDGQIYHRYGGENFESFIKFLEKSFIKEFRIGLDTFRLCKAGDETISSFGSDDQTNAENLRDICAEQGGKIASMREYMELLCDRFKDYSFGDDIFSITCSNYKDVLVFDHNGELIDSEIMASALASSTSMHNEL